MKNLLLSSLVVTVICLAASCTYTNQAANGAKSRDTTNVAAPDTTHGIPGDSLQTIHAAWDTSRAVAAPGDTVEAGSSRTESTEQGTVSRHSGAVKNPGPDQALTDSIKRVKTEEKKK